MDRPHLTGTHMRWRRDWRTYGVPLCQVVSVAVGHGVGDDCPVCGRSTLRTGYHVIDSRSGRVLRRVIVDACVECDP